MSEETAAVAATPAAATPKKKAKSGAVKSKANPPTHPKVSEMVVKSITTLKERGGSSLQAIKKHISSQYKVDIDRLTPFIKKYLKSAVAAGTLVQTKGKGANGSFKLSKKAKAPAKKTAKPKEKAEKKKKPAAKKSTGGTKKVAKPKSPKKAKKKAKAPAKKTAKPKEKAEKKKKPAAKKSTGGTKKVAKPKSPKKAKATKPKAPKPKKLKTPKKAAPKKAAKK
ncbi:unnamed protein product [Larinioides sclopetarius]|uniref:H15 domain-containing protein n=1 Tax=Larinioides sclopetarius TaxID=280406 RepID=A0AAV2C0Y7_9ARAC